MPLVMSEEDLQKAIESCAKEPIHIPGSIQPQGYMFILDKDFTIVKISVNC